MFLKVLNNFFSDLSYNKISSISGQIFPPKSKLQTLNFASNSIEILEPECFSYLENLKELKLNRNRLSSLPKLTFFPLVNLQVSLQTLLSLTKY